MAAISLDMISIDDPVGDRPRMTKSILVKIWICAAVFTFVSKVQVANLFQLAEQVISCTDRLLLVLCN